MKTLIIILFIIFSTSGVAQEKNSNKKHKVTNSDDKSFYSEDDTMGNTIFIKNVGMNGPITMILASTYDSLNRLTKSYMVHSNIGFYLTEYIYENNCLKSYEYKMKIDSSFSYKREILNKINTREEFIEMKAFYYLQNGKKQLSNADYFDSLNNKIKELSFSENGDTISINTYEYNDKNQQTCFHKYTIDSETWSWDIYYLYDENSNKIKSSRVSFSNGTKDTTEVHNYTYDSKNQLISENYFYKNTFGNKSEYSYNKKDQLVTVLFYERDEKTIDAKTLYKYYKNGDVKKKIVFDYREQRSEQKEVFKIKKEK